MGNSFNEGLKIGIDSPELRIHSANLDALESSIAAGNANRRASKARKDADDWMKIAQHNGNIVDELKIDVKVKDKVIQAKDAQIQALTAKNKQLAEAASSIMEASLEKTKVAQSYIEMTQRLKVEVSDLTKRTQEQADLAKLTMKHDNVMTEAARTRQVILAGMRAALREALDALEKSNPNHPLLNKENRQKLFNQYAKAHKQKMIEDQPKNFELPEMHLSTLVQSAELDVTDLDRQLSTKPGVEITQAVPELFVQQAKKLGGGDKLYLVEPSLQLKEEPFL